eukprot:1484308-Alexandrium_andersonii.AAC.1
MALSACRKDDPGERRTRTASLRASGQRRSSGGMCPSSRTGVPAPAQVFVEVGTRLSRRIPAPRARRL